MECQLINSSFILWFGPSTASNFMILIQFSSVAQLCLTLQPQGLSHARLPCPSPSSKACSNSYPLSQWCYPTILSSVIPFSCLQSFPASGSFLMNWLFSSGSQSFIISPSSEYSGLISFGTDWFNLLAVQGTLQSLLQHHCSKASVFQHSALFMVQISHPYMTTGKTIVLSVWIFVSKVMSLLFNNLSRFVIALSKKH